QTVYIGSADHSVYAVAVSTASKSGSRIWSRRIGGPVRSGLALDGTTLYAGSDDGYLYAIDITTTTVRWRFGTGGPVRSRILDAGRGGEDVLAGAGFAAGRHDVAERLGVPRVHQHGRRQHLVDAVLELDVPVDAGGDLVPVLRARQRRAVELLVGGRQDAGLV